MPDFIDQTGRRLTIHQTPCRIISLVPSQTELLFDLGLTDEVVGITKFCVHPDTWFRTKARVGGTKDIKMHLVKQLNPDLIIANKEENLKEQVEELATHYPVWISDVNDLTSAYDMISQLGSMTGKSEAANTITKQIGDSFSNIPRANNQKPRTCYLIWRNPYMTVGGDTFIHSMLEVAGFDNLFKSSTRYPEISIEELALTKCEVLLLSSEPFPFSEKHIAELKPLLPNTKIFLVDGEMFSWYGSRLLQAPAYFERLQKQEVLKGFFTT